MVYCNKCAFLVYTFLLCTSAVLNSARLCLASFTLQTTLFTGIVLAEAAPEYEFI